MKRSAQRFILLFLQDTKKRSIRFRGESKPAELG